MLSNALSEQPVRAPKRIETARLVLRRPVSSDAHDIYASDPETTRFLGWPMHQSLADTRAFVRFSNAEWMRWPAGPYVVLSRGDESLLGATGLSFETPYRAATGCVLARDAWGQGYATEVLRAMVEAARAVGARRLYALCHTEHRASRRVLEKCGFSL